MVAKEAETATLVVRPPMAVRVFSFFLFVVLPGSLVPLTFINPGENPDNLVGVRPALGAFFLATTTLWVAISFVNRTEATASEFRSHRIFRRSRTLQYSDLALVEEQEVKGGLVWTLYPMSGDQPSLEIPSVRQFRDRLIPLLKAARPDQFPPPHVQPPPRRSANLYVGSRILRPPCSKSLGFLALALATTVLSMGLIVGLGLRFPHPVVAAIQGIIALFFLFVGYAMFRRVWELGRYRIVVTSTDLTVEPGSRRASLSELEFRSDTQEEWVVFGSRRNTVNWNLWFAQANRVFLESALDELGEQKWRQLYDLLLPHCAWAGSSAENRR